MPFISNPTLALGMNGIGDDTPQFPFLDLMKQSRPWKGDMATGDDLEYEDLVTGGYLDANGWPTHMPEGMSNIQTLWDFGAGTKGAEGPFVCTYEGSGTLNINWANVTHSEAGRIEFTNPGGDLFWMSIEATDPEDTGDYIRNIRIVRPKYEALLDAGEIFNPDFLAIISPARQLRFMDWMHTNNSTQGVWADRPKATDVTWNSEKGVPLEVMVALANKVGANPWFNMPHLATDAYAKNFATYVRDNLNTGLVANVEYSNEFWNFNFGQFTWLAAQATAVWGLSGGDYWVQYGAKRATELMLIWDDVFGVDAATRTYKILGVHPGWQAIAEATVNPYAWEDEEPENYVDPGTTFDALAVTTYFGGEHVSTGGFPFTISIGSPGVITARDGLGNEVDHGLSVGDPIRIYTTGALPTGATNGGDYFVASTPTSKTLTFTETVGGAPINTSDSESGTHSVVHKYRLELLKEIEAHEEDVDTAYDWVTDRLLNRADIFSSVPWTATNWAFYRDLSKVAGLDMVAYEGGNHEHHSSFTGMPQVVLDKFTPFYIGWSYSPQCAEVYEAQWANWSEVGDGPFMQFTDVGTPNQYGSFPMLRSLTDSNARADKLYELNATFPAWGGMIGGDHFLPQVVDQLEDGETAEFNIRGGRLIGGGFNQLIADRPLSEFALSRDASGHLHVGDMELRDFRGGIVFPAS